MSKGGGTPAACDYSFWAWFVTPPVFGVAVSPLKVGVNYWMHAFGVRSILCDALYHISAEMQAFSAEMSR